MPPLEKIPKDLKRGEDTITTSFLTTIVKMWISGSISNFDYLMMLNYLAGRTFDNPNFLCFLRVGIKSKLSNNVKEMY